MERAIRALSRVLDLIAAALLIVLTLAVFATVAMRYVLRVSVPEVQMIIRFSITWLVFLAAASAVYKDRHLRLDLFKERIPRSVKRVVEIVVRVVVAFCLVYIVMTAHEAFIRSLRMSEPINRSFTQAYYVSGLLVGTVLMAVLHLTKSILETIRSFRRGE